MRFTDQYVGEVGVESTWRKEQHPADQQTQTPSFEVVENEMQTLVSLFRKHETEDQEAQTEDRPPGVPDPEVDDGEEAQMVVFPGMEGGDDFDKMGKFLDGVIPELSDMIAANVHSFAFEGYDVKWDTERTTVDLLHTLSAPMIMQEDADLQCVGTSWNSTGSVIAAAYGRIDLVGWCKSNGYVCCWNVTRKEVTRPDVVIENSSYITSIAFHPTSPSLLLGGSYTGEVVLWDISAEQPTLGTTNVQAEEAHRDPVVRVMWLLDRMQRVTDVNRFLMCSASGDGRVLFWTRKQQEPQFDMPASGYVIKPQAPASGFLRRRTGDQFSLNEHGRGQQDSREEVCNRVGLLSLCVMHSAAAVVEQKKCPSIDSRFVLGTEQGDVYATTMDVPKVKAQTWAFKSLKVGQEVHGYDPHYGPVQACASSPFERNLFLTASSDGTAKLRNLLDSTLLTLEPGTSAEDYIYAAEFSPFRPCVVALGMRNSTVVIYDLQESTVKPVVVEAGDGQPIVSLSFNNNNSTLLATGDGKGLVKIWQLPNSMTELSKGEKQLMSIPASGDAKKKDCWFSMTGMKL
eukprot:TRINITY_DN23368_c0_g1_i1.p1 TRINITY_DN23368_c0_g1~~TRINITY_DN23368_c0_g1_i1.p1  ORF type:complete len:571 (+),score=278.66 TRINITY_DN23368_c0_g1_i1:76-1788(+)